MTLRFLKDQPTAACAAAAVEPVTAELTAAYDRIRTLERTLAATRRELAAVCDQRNAAVLRGDIKVTVTP